MKGKTVTLFNDRLSQPVASGATLTYKATFFDENDEAIVSSDLDSLILSVIDTATGDIINEVDGIDILNTDRGAVDGAGKLTIVLEPEDTILTVGKSADRSLILQWTFNSGHVGRHQVDFKVIALSGDIAP